MKCVNRCTNLTCKEPDASLYLCAPDCGSGQDGCVCENTYVRDEKTGKCVKFVNCT